VQPIKVWKIENGDDFDVMRTHRCENFVYQGKKREPFTSYRHNEESIVGIIVTLYFLNKFFVKIKRSIFGGSL